LSAGAAAPVAEQANAASAANDTRANLQYSFGRINAPSIEKREEN
jgi:hypothetical protein